MSNVINLPKFAVLHCSATNDSNDIGVEEIRKWHLAKGWSDVGYHYIVRRNGTIEKGRPDNVVGAHVESHNEGSLGVCWVGSSMITEAQKYALIYIYNMLRIWYGISSAKWYGHREFDTAIKQGKTCPNIDIQVVKYWFDNQKP